MLKLPGKLTPETFLSGYWQKAPLFMPRAIDSMRPAITRNELAWLATLDDVESRIVFTEHTKERTRYRVKTGPFDATFLEALPGRDWSLLVHDVEKHLPAMRRLFEQVPFIPDWRIDDLMISFAAPGGGVGPHRDNYDVFLCQGIGIREWRFSSGKIGDDVLASDELALLQEFHDGEHHVTRQGDVLYLPPGIAHWGTAKRACLTYSIGMHAPAFYTDPDLQLQEIRPGYISSKARSRAGQNASSLGRAVTDLKDWLKPQAPTDQEIAAMIAAPETLRQLQLHGMTRIAYDTVKIYVNGADRSIEDGAFEAIASLCTRRKLNKGLVAALGTACLRWLLAQGAFALPENS